MKFRTQKKYRTYKQRVYRSRWRPTREELNEVGRKGTEAVLNASPDELERFRKWV